MAIPSVGGAQETVCLPLELVHGWLFKINDRRIQNEAIREKLVEYQRECYRVLFDHFHGKVTDRGRGNTATGADGELTQADIRKLPFHEQDRLITQAGIIGGRTARAKMYLRAGWPATPEIEAVAATLQYEISFGVVGRA